MDLLSHFGHGAEVVFLYEERREAVVVEKEVGLVYQGHGLVVAGAKDFAADVPWTHFDGSLLTPLRFALDVGSGEFFSITCDKITISSQLKQSQSQQSQMALVYLKGSPDLALSIESW